MIGRQRTTDVLVVGAGITGLAAAWAASRAGASVEVLEGGPQVGGMISSERTSGFLVERGPTSMLSSPSLDELIDGVGLTGDVMAPGPDAKRRYVVRNGRMHAVPMSPASLVTSGLLSARAKVRALCEPLVPRRGVEGPEETLASLVTRRFGAEVLDYVVDPFVSGVYAGDPARLSSRHCLRFLSDKEHSHGSVLVGAALAARDRRKPRRHMMSFRDGLARLPGAIAEALPGRVWVNHRVVAVERDGEGWSVRSNGPAGERRTRAASVVVTTPAHALASIDVPWSLRRDLRIAAAVSYAPVTTIALGFRCEDVAHPLDGFGVLVPRAERSPILGALFNSTILPNRAPEGQVLITCFVGDSGESAPAQVERRVLDALGPLLGIIGVPTLVRVSRWARAIPQYELGHDAIHGAVHRIAAAHPGFELVGSYCGGVSLGDCAESGLAAGARAAGRNSSIVRTNAAAARLIR